MASGTQAEERAKYYAKKTSASKRKDPNS